MTAERDPLLLSIGAVTERLSCGRTKIRDLVKAQELEAVKLGRRTLITEQSVRQLADRLPRVRT